MVRLGRLDVRLVDPEQRKLEKQKQKGGKRVAEAMQDLGEEKCSLEFELDKGIKIYGQFWKEVPELEAGEVIVASVPNINFFKEYLTDKVSKGLGDNYDVMRRGFEHLLRGVDRRAPFEDIFAGIKGHYLSIKNEGEYGKVSPQRLEANHISSFKGELSAAIRQAADKGMLTNDVKWLIGKYNQLLPYTLQIVFFADHEGSPNFGRQIEEKFGNEVRGEVAEYVKQKTNDPIFTMLRLSTIDSAGIITDYILSKESDSVKFNAAHYLAASEHFGVVMDQTQAEKLQTALEQRINEGKIKMTDLNEGVSLYLDQVIGNSSYRVSVKRKGNDFVLEEREDAKHVRATVVATDERFANVLKGLIKNHKKAGAKVSWCDNFNFPYL